MSGTETQKTTIERADELALPLIKKWEGLHKLGKDGLVYPYRDPAGYWTIGYGTLLKGPQGPITVEKAEELLRYRYYEAMRDALGYSPILLFYPSQLAAITSFIYNLGPTRYRSSTLRKKVDERNWQEAAYQIQRWVYAGGRKLNGLIARRKEEANLIWET